MAIMKDALLTQQEFLDNLQKFVLCGRVCLDAIEKMAMLFPAAESTDGSKICQVDEAETVVGASSVSTRNPEASGSLGHSTAPPCIIE